MCSSQPTSQETVTSGADNHIIWVRPAKPDDASNAAAADDEDNTDAAPLSDQQKVVYSMCAYDVDNLLLYTCIITFIYLRGKVPLKYWM